MAKKTNKAKVDGRTVRGQKMRKAKARVWRKVAEGLQNTGSGWGGDLEAKEANRLARELRSRAKRLG